MAESSKGRVNGYGCQNRQCRYVMVTVDVDDGVTPFMVGCPNCGTQAHSFFYPTQGCPPAEKATHEWYAPDEEERRELSAAELDQVERGGLLLQRLRADHAESDPRTEPRERHRQRQRHQDADGAFDLHQQE